MNIPLDQLPDRCRFISLIQSMRGKFQVHLELQRTLKLNPYTETIDIIGNGRIPEEAWGRALDEAKRRLAA